MSGIAIVLDGGELDGLELELEHPTKVLSIPVSDHGIILRRLFYGYSGYATAEVAVIYNYLFQEKV